MNRHQKSVLIIGCAVLLFLAVAPPWRAQYTQGTLRIWRTLGHRVGSPTPPDIRVERGAAWPPLVLNGGIASVYVDLYRGSLEYVGVIGAVALLAFALRTKKV